MKPGRGSSCRSGRIPRLAEQPDRVGGEHGVGHRSTRNDLIHDEPAVVKASVQPLSGLRHC